MIFQASHPPLLSGNNQFHYLDYINTKKSYLVEEEHWMYEALKLAQHASLLQEVPVGAIIVYDKEVIGKGWNQPIVQNDPCAHAEIVALRDAAKTIQNYRLVNTTLYVTLEPCTMCVGAMLHARIKKLVFGAYDPKSGAAGTVFNLLSDSRHNHSIDVSGGVLEQECGKLLQGFFQSRR